jgi:flagellar basal-body rod modification protein FlgD
MTISNTYSTTIAAANATATANAASTSSTISANTTNTLAKLAGNFNDFLSLLTTQLKNQDPTAPMDTNQFTSQLVQFTGVAEQINTNATLGQILTSSQTQQLSQASAIVGDKVAFTGGVLPLQNGAAQVNFQTDSAEPVQIAVVNSNGATVQTQTVNAASGANTWTWDGTNANGTALPDGAYTVAVTANGTAVPFQSVGTVTGAEQVNQVVNLQFGGAVVPYSQVVSLSAAGT